MIIPALLLLTQLAAPVSSPPTLSPLQHSVQGGAYAPDGRLALAIRGDLWIEAAPGDTAHWVQLTADTAWDRAPAWAPDGATLVYASARDGQSHLYRIRVGAHGATGAPEPVTTAGDWDSEPTVRADGSILFVRGRGAVARLWIRSPDGSEHRLTTGKNVERWPALSPDGKRVAYVVLREEGDELHVRWLAGDSDRVIVNDRAVERPAWSPSGDRVAFATRSGPPGVWITAAGDSSAGDYVNLASPHRAAPVWSPDGRTLALIELPPPSPSYNGDPDRLGDREAGAVWPSSGRLWLTAAPSAPGAGTEVSLSIPADIRAYDAAEFDRAWSRTLRLYYAGADAGERRARWRALRDVYRPRALAAKTPTELATIIHQMLHERPSLRASATGRAAVSSANPVATEAGLEILRKGGNVVDAAVAVSFALGVVEPDASGVGGYGQMLVRIAPNPAPELIEFMTRLPEGTRPDEPFVTRGGRYPDDGPVLPNVPGTVAAMYKAWQEYGSHKVPWADLLAPAIRAAEEGYVVTDGLATTLATERAHFLEYPGSRKLFFPNGEPLHAGDTLRNPDLAWTLRQIADSGANAFYRGTIAHRIVADLRGQGNAIRLTDLARYYAAEREPVATTYRGYTVYSSAPPVTGGATLAAQLGMLEQLPRSALPAYTEDPATLHAMIEAWKLVPPSRGRIADPGLWPVNVTAYTSKDSARARWVCFDPRHALEPSDVDGDTLPCARDATHNATTGASDTRPSRSSSLSPSGAPCGDGEPEPGESRCHRTGTTAFVVADAEGNVVAVTQTLGTWGGSFYVTPGLGFIYNDKVTSYPRDPDAYGTALPNERNGSTIAPTIVFQGSGSARRPVLAVGAAGNAWITSAVYTVVTGVLDHGLGVQQALELPRFLLTRERDGRSSRYVVELEDGFAPGVAPALASRGQHLDFISLPGELRMGYAAAITMENGRVTAGADPRRAGAAGAVGCGSDEGRDCRR
jgi:gamma-glutamyltranspeptidase